MLNIKFIKMSGSDEDMSTNSNISSAPESSYSPPSQLVPQLTVSPINTDISLHGVVSIVYITVILIMITRTYYRFIFPRFFFSWKPRVQPIENSAILQNFFKHNLFILLTATTIIRQKLRARILTFPPFCLDRLLH